MNETLATVLTILIPVLGAGAAWLRAEFLARKAKAEAEHARLERELAQLARAEAVEAKDVVLGSAAAPPDEAGRV